MAIEQLKSLLADDLQAVDQAIHGLLDSDIPLIPLLGNYVIDSGGKRLRPMVLLAATRMFGYEGDRHLKLAAVIEFIHTATLMHDDVVDDAEQRRTRPTANALWGAQAPVLVGDFLFARSFEAMVSDGDMRVLEILSGATRELAEGEVLQLANMHDPEVDEASYLRVVTAKTAVLFEAAARIAAIVSGRPAEEEERIAAYGHHLGVAFQLIDDCLDYSATAEAWGKQLGNDLEEGKPTLPTIHALAHTDHQGRDAIRRALEEEGVALLDPVRTAIERTGALEYTVQSARERVDTAKESLAGLPDTEERRALEALADFVVTRDF
ncbi:octaprenyl diphosphate synthase [Thiohalorhabdus denitrificans]|uniref:Octaprenyl diphosphate synthase n=1 Tax=Thiohalorhabdus denitrificans TaxID=381306 RepID=A0A0P9CEQ5_9GAMM|nr:polyprenyl synthetase family protein [Thiohalorhabdus denitrificans]KPV41426.1 octaprenyl diphosphate synthase [Thiohalorhabdus denitrificans]SCY26926.1 octaprenyl-diphosphate synthase [Thiohalorhabdus denitrificans]